MGEWSSMKSVHYGDRVERGGMSAVRQFIRDERCNVAKLLTGTFAVMAVFAFVAVEYLPALSWRQTERPSTATMDVLAYDLTAARQFSGASERRFWLPAAFTSSSDTSFR